MNDIERKEVKEAIDAADNALTHLGNARAYLNSAGNWGILDVLGGNTITWLFKHGKMSKAEREIDEAKRALERLNRELKDVKGCSSIHIDEFLTIADVFLDGFIVDLWVQSKISDAKKQCDEAIRQVDSIRSRLLSIR